MSELVPRKLTLIATELRHEVEQAEGHWQSAVQHAIQAGELLTEAKAQVKHGEWLPWLGANFPASTRTAQGYMRLAERAEDAQRLAHLGVGGALKELAAPKEDTPPGGHRRAAFEEMEALGVKFTATSLTLPDDLPFGKWVKIGRLLADLVGGQDGADLDSLLARSSANRTTNSTLSCGWN